MSDLSWLGPVADLGTGLINTIFQGAENEKNRRWQQRNIDIAREREDNAHQREMADLQKAGINPLMTATGGSGALSAMPGAPATSALPGIPNVGESVIDMLRYSNETRKIDEEVKKLSTETSLNLEKIVNLQAEKELTNAKTESERQGVLESQQRISESLQKIQNLIEEKATEQTKQALNKATAALSYNEIQQGLAKINYLQEQAKTQTVTRSMLMAQVKDLQGEKVRRWLMDIWKNLNDSIKAGAQVADSLIPF